MSTSGYLPEMPVWLDPDDPKAAFPPVERALDDPQGLLAIGGDLSVKRLLNAYRHGIFPWYEEGQPILWWCPDPRAVIFTDKLKISRSLKKTLRNRDFRVTVDQAFPAVMQACAEPRPGSHGTWITTDMVAAYTQLHQHSYAHSIEIWNQEDELIGGLYGVLLNRVFSGESMFNKERDMSKVALVYLAEWLKARQIRLIDCQIPNPHLASLGAEPMPRREFLQYLAP